MSYRGHSLAQVLLGNRKDQACSPSWGRVCVAVSSSLGGAPGDWSLGLSSLPGGTGSLLWEEGGTGS